MKRHQPRPTSGPRAAYSARHIVAPTGPLERRRRASRRAEALAQGTVDSDIERTRDACCNWRLTERIRTTTTSSFAQAENFKKNYSYYCRSPAESSL